jgi:predicted PolB exonuclease-like 3'-5' exonuclease
MISKSRLESMLFFDIETSGKYANYSEFQNADPAGAEIWKKKMNRLKIEDYAKGYETQVALFPEFGRIVCLSYGIWKNGKMTINTISNDDEEVTMKLIAGLFQKAAANGLSPTGWNIKNFDIPWVIRKILNVGLPVPSCISTYDKKPWETSIVDLKEFWKSFSSLDVTFEEALYSMGIPTPKDDIDGSQVHENFHLGNIERIKTYCEKDVKTMIDLMYKVYSIHNQPVGAAIS